MGKRSQKIRLGNLDIVILGARGNEASQITSALLMMAPAVRRSVGKIEIWDDCPYRKHYAYRESSAGHCHAGQNSAICLRRGYFISSTVWHEATHAYYAQLSADAKKEYARIAGRVYVGYDLASRDKRRFPRDGLLGRHSGANQNEDIACWVAEINECAADPEHYRGPMWGVSWNDPRNLAKIRFFKKWGLITTIQFEAIRKFQRGIVKT